MMEIASSSARFLLDTNVISELVRPRPDSNVIAWMNERSGLDLSLSVLTVGEIEKGILSMQPGDRRRQLSEWAATEIPRQFAGRVLPVTTDVARQWGQLSADGQAKGRYLPVVDGLILATAAANGLVLVTRNVADCAGRGVPVYDPWTRTLHE